MVGQVTRYVALAMMVCLASLVLIAPASASHWWNGYHWPRTSNPFVVSAIDNTAGRFTTEITAAASDWSASSVLHMEVVPACQDWMNCVHVYSGEYGLTGWLGATSPLRDWDGHFVSLDVRLNETYLNGSYYGSRQHTTCHELGHSLGLDHQYENRKKFGTCMRSSVYGGAWDHPNAHDYEQLETIYAHGD
jgi:predicted Zn-dependent protease